MEVVDGPPVEKMQEWECKAVWESKQIVENKEGAHKARLPAGQQLLAPETCSWKRTLCQSDW